MKRIGEERGPRGSEAQAKEWLEQVANDVDYVGDGEGPPDFVVRFGGQEVAVEVTRMLDGEGWPPEQRIAFERALGAVVRSVRDEPGRPRWHVWCEYDPREPRPPRRGGAWEELVRHALRTPGSAREVQLIPEGSRAGRGIIVEYCPAGNGGSFSGVSEDIGLCSAGTASTRIAASMAEKARKVCNGRRAGRFTYWWLVLVEEVVFVHGTLGAEWADVVSRVRGCDGIEQWNKVILLSRVTGEWTAVYERPGDLVLREHRRWIRGMQPVPQDLPSPSFPKGGS